jgi:hypothetical protein
MAFSATHEEIEQTQLLELIAACGPIRQIRRRAIEALNESNPQGLDLLLAELDADHHYAGPVCRCGKPRRNNHTHCPECECMIDIHGDGLEECSN